MLTTHKPMNSQFSGLFGNNSRDLTGNEILSLLALLNKNYSPLEDTLGNKWKKVWVAQQDKSDNKLGVKHFITFNGKYNNKKIEEKLRTIFGEELEYKEDGFHKFSNVAFLRKIQKEHNNMQRLLKYVDFLNKNYTPLELKKKYPWYVERKSPDSEDFFIRFNGAFSNPEIDQSLVRELRGCLQLKKDGFHVISNINHLEEMMETYRAFHQLRF